MKFGERLAFERKRLGYKQPDWAEQCGVKSPTQSLYETGKRSPDADYLQSACQLGADPMFLLTGVRAGADGVGLSDAQRRPLIAFQGLPPKVQSAIVGLAEAMRGDGGDHG